MIFHLSWLLFQEFHRNFAILLKTAALERVMNHNDLPGTKTFDWLDSANLHSVDGFMIKVFQYNPACPQLNSFHKQNWMWPNKLMRFIRDEKPFSLQSKLIKNSNIKIFMIWIEWENVWLTSWQWSSVDRERILMSVVLSCSLLSNRFTNVVNASLC